jgi:hypothetical protein
MTAEHILFNGNSILFFVTEYSGQTTLYLGGELQSLTPPPSGRGTAGSKLRHAPTYNKWARAVLNEKISRTQTKCRKKETGARARRKILTGDS